MRLHFAAAGRLHSLAACEIAEVTRPVPCTRVPNAPPCLLGLSNLRGRVVPVVALATLLGEPPLAPTPATRLVVLAGDSPVGLLVDRVAGFGEAADATPLDAATLLAGAFTGLRRSQAARQPHIARDKTSVQVNPAYDQRVLILRDGGQDYALPLAEVAEIGRLSQTPVALPRCDAPMLGAIGWRGASLPAVSLAALLGRAEQAAGADRSQRAMVVVVVVGGTRLGLVVDAVTGTASLPISAIDPVPLVLTRGRAEASLRGICRLDGGRRLAILLASEHLLDARTTAALHEAAEGQQLPHAPEPAPALSERYVLFSVAGEQYGLPAGAVLEVVRSPASLTRLPNLPDFILGVMSHRGQVVPVIDMARRFDLAAPAGRIVIIVSSDGLLAGLAVHAVSAVVELSPAELRDAPAFDEARQMQFDQVALRPDGGVVLLISPGCLLRSAERDLLAELPAARDAHTPRAA